MVNNGTTWGRYHHESEEMQMMLKEAYEELKEMWREENIISAVIHETRQRPYLHCDFVPLTKRGNLSAKDVIGDKAKCAGRKRNS